MRTNPAHEKRGHHGIEALELANVVQDEAQARIAGSGSRFQLQPCLFSLSHMGFIRSSRALGIARPLRTCSSARKRPPGTKSTESLGDHAFNEGDTTENQAEHHFSLWHDCLTLPAKLGSRVLAESPCLFVTMTCGNAHRSGVRRRPLSHIFFP